MSKITIPANHWLRFVRKDEDLTQVEMAKILGVGHETYRRFEVDGARLRLDVGQWASLLAFLQMSFEQVMKIFDEGFTYDPWSPNALDKLKPH